MGPLCDRESSEDVLAVVLNSDSLNFKHEQVIRLIIC